MTDLPALRSCPFCGGEPSMTAFSNGLIGESWPLVRCTSCDAAGPMADTIDDEAQAAARWNARTQDAAS